MGAKKAAAKQPERSPMFKGYQKVTVSLPPEQATALKQEALRRAFTAGGARPDAGEIVREALDAWLAKNTKR
jgi:Arc/MetJ-type ribon-helix-helix transcriptional regulator